MKKFEKTNGTSPGGSREQRLLRQEFGHLSTKVILDLPVTGGGTRVIGFASSNPGEGCSSVATNYAVFCGQQGLRTTIVETVLRRPTLAKFFGVDEGPGLWDVLDGVATPEEAIQLGVAEGVNLMPAGSAPKDVILAGESFDLSSVFEYLAPHNDLIVVDVPPLTSSPESNLILPQLGGVVLVVQANRSRLCSLEKAVHSINQLGVTVLGSVFNRMRYEMPSILDRML